ncbi:MAG: PspA/IM30 family protein [Myxococcales bacterium]|nr:PspA/IM30 family protein [Myxococcales bacterium]
MTSRRPGLLARLVGYVRGSLGSWLRGRETDNPQAVYENAITERVKQYRELKEAVAGILYMRNKLEAEIAERRGELARTLEDLRRAVQRSDDELALRLVTRKQTLEQDLEHAERELESVRGEAEEAKTNLVSFREEIRQLEREKGRVMATLANSKARRRIQEALAGISVDADMRALEAVREHAARASTERVLDTELEGMVGLDSRLRAIRDEARQDAAQRELDELKRQMGPVAEPATAAEPAEPAAAAEPVRPMKSMGASGRGN